jgi:hypothetical protein
VTLIPLEGAKTGTSRPCELVDESDEELLLISRGARSCAPTSRASTATAAGARRDRHAPQRGRRGRRHRRFRAGWRAAQIGTMTACMRRGRHRWTGRGTERERVCERLPHPIQRKSASTSTSTPATPIQSWRARSRPTLGASWARGRSVRVANENIFVRSRQRPCDRDVFHHPADLLVRSKSRSWSC